ncbi:MAG: hypothetical protein ACRDZR_02895, partial [Acidimicrobiales bacterium]
RWPVPSEFYAVEDVERSWGIYLEVHESYPGAVLIGGWAAWLHSRAARSHDIDLIVPLDELSDMREALDLSENAHFGSPKWRGEYDGIHLDVYAPYRSRLGAILQLPVEHLLDHVIEIDGFPTLSREALLVAKAAARLDRPDTLPGKKDASDMAGMLLGNDSWDFGVVHAVASQSQRDDAPQLVLEALGGLADEEGNRARSRRLRSIQKEAVRAFARAAVE